MWSNFSISICTFIRISSFKIKCDKNIHGTNIFNDDFLYTAYADDKTFFLKDLDSIKNVLKMLNQFHMVSSLRPNLSKYEIWNVSGLGSLKDAKVALCGLKRSDLTKDSIKILCVRVIIKSFRLI